MAGGTDYRLRQAAPDNFAPIPGAVGALLSAAFLDLPRNVIRFTASAG
jgi:hypothetical protein